MKRASCWTPAEDKQLLADAIARTPRKTTAQRLGRTKGACDMRLMRLMKLRGSEARKPIEAEKLADLLYLRDIEEMTWSAIALRIGLPRSTCENHYNKHRSSHPLPMKRMDPPPQPEVPAAPKRKYYKASLGAVISQAPPSARQPRTVPMSVLVADQDLRDRIRERGLTGGLLGDPAPGRSALDQRKG
jgi:hypothetical protein